MFKKEAFFNSDNCLKEFTWRNKKVNERVARYPKILCQAQALPLSDDTLKPLYPGKKLNIFSLRIDADEIEPDEFKQYLALLTPFASWVTIFCPAYAFVDKEHLLKEAKDKGFDIQSHGFYHHVYRNYENNYRNLLKAKDFFGDIGINTTGFAAPMGWYNANLMYALENLGYRYSSDFSFDYLNFPHYPKLGKRFSRVLQIPIFPICPELLLMNHFTGEEIMEYYENAITGIKNTNIPIILYCHTDIRYKETKSCLKQILEKIKEDDKLYKCNMSDFASWCFSVEDKNTVDRRGIINAACISGVLKLPPPELLGVPVNLNPVAKMKQRVKDLIDFERITPAAELKGNSLVKGIKLFSRKLIRQK